MDHALEVVTRPVSGVGGSQRSQHKRFAPASHSAAGRIPGLHPGRAVATVSAFGWAGFVCGPPVIGQVSVFTALPVALGANRTEPGRWIGDADIASWVKQS